ncbi:uncharacterized protein LOC131930159 [Physella acuta]|uniref:uncharacterized protein LOC131930159 n=1 Tax=Physella acuta TaxID=109671 RepID=UPI0027DBF454|nr:uncharacterized protein LOC131930159 [Physella acuta]
MASKISSPYVDLQLLPKPSLRRAISTCQMDPSMDASAREARLQKQRRETEAIRKLWKSLRDSKTGTHDTTTQQQLYRELCQCGGIICVNCRSPVKLSDSTRQVQCKTALGLLGHNELDTSMRRKSKSSLPREHSKGVSLEHMRSNIKAKTWNPDINETEDMRRADGSLKTPKSVTLFCLPRVYEESRKLPSYPTRDVGEWNNEIKKVVPKRPELSQPVYVMTRPMIVPAELEIVKHPAGFFHLSCRSRRPREYVVNTEWHSESLSGLHSVGR